MLGNSWDLAAKHQCSDQQKANNSVSGAPPQTRVTKCRAFLFVCLFFVDLGVSCFILFKPDCSKSVFTTVLTAAAAAPLLAPVSGTRQAADWKQPQHLQWMKTQTTARSTSQGHSCKLLHRSSNACLARAAIIPRSKPSRPMASVQRARQGRERSCCLYSISPPTQLHCRFIYMEI